MENLLRADLKRRVRKARTENFSQPKDEDQDEKEDDDDDDGDKIKLGAADMPQKPWRDDLQEAAVINVDYRACRRSRTGNTQRSDFCFTCVCERRTIIGTENPPTLSV